MKMEEYDHKKLGDYWVNELIGDDFELKLEFESLIENLSWMYGTIFQNSIMRMHGLSMR